MLTPHEIENAVQSLSIAKTSAYQAVVAQAEAQARLEAARARAMREGLIKGKNADERDACARALLPELYAAVEQAEAQLTHAKHEVEMAALGLRRVELLLRLMEAGKEER